MDKFPEEVVNNTTVYIQYLRAELTGEVDEGSILDRKEATKSYWEFKMLAAMDDTGWEPVSNVRFQSGPSSKFDPLPNSVTPPPQFGTEIDSVFDHLTPVENSLDDISIDDVPTHITKKPQRRYMFGSQEELLEKTSDGSKSKKENVIEAEIRAQQLREDELKRETQLRHREKEGGALSPSSHASDEGFEDRPTEDILSHSSHITVARGYIHTLRGAEGEHIIYDAVSPPSQFFCDNDSSTGSCLETKIAMEIRELKEREAELRTIRQMREREQKLLTDGIHKNEIEGGHSPDDHLTSITTSTDEGNYSEYGDPNSSEDKSSDGSGSRMMSPDLQLNGSHAECRQRKPVSVKPFEDEDSEEQPVYTRMHRESVIEREIRIAKEREDAFRLEKGLLPVTSPSAERDPYKEKDSPRGRDDQDHLRKPKGAASREREFKGSKNIGTPWVDNVVCKVSQMTDRPDEQNSSQDLLSSSKSQTPNSSKKLSIESIASPDTSPSFTPSPVVRSPSQTRLTRSLSTTNLSATGGVMRAPQKGLMQKFFASKGRLAPETFVRVRPNRDPSSQEVPTRPMSISVKPPVILTECLRRQDQIDGPKMYRRTHSTAEEKIQEELRQMKQREEELRCVRGKTLAKSQPNLFQDSENSAGVAYEGVDSRSFLDLQSSNPNFLDEVPPRKQTHVEENSKVLRRKNALIAHWEGKIQQSNDT